MRQMQSSLFLAIRLSKKYDLERRTITLGLTGETCAQSYKASMIVIYESRVVNISNFLVTTTLESYIIYAWEDFIRLATIFAIAA